jgi:tape measure domain-containing protein
VIAGLSVARGAGVGFVPAGRGKVSAVVSGSTVYAERAEELVRVALGEPAAVSSIVRSQADQVLSRLGGALRSGRPPEERIAALIETYMHGAFQQLAEAAGEDRITFAEAEVTAAAVASAMDRAADAAERGDPKTVAAAMASAEAVLDLDFAALYDLLL